MCINLEMYILADVQEKSISKHQKTIYKYGCLHAQDEHYKNPQSTLLKITEIKVASDLHSLLLI